MLPVTLAVRYKCKVWPLVKSQIADKPGFSGFDTNDRCRSHCDACAIEGALPL